MLTRKRDYEVFAIIIKDVKKALNLKAYIDLRLLIPKEYHDLINVFKK